MSETNIGEIAIRLPIGPASPWNGEDGPEPERYTFFLNNNAQYIAWPRVVAGMWARKTFSRAHGRCVCGPGAALLWIIERAADQIDGLARSGNAADTTASGVCDLVLPYDGSSETLTKSFNIAAPNPAHTAAWLRIVGGMYDEKYQVGDVIVSTGELAVRWLGEEFARKIELDMATRERDRDE